MRDLIQTYVNWIKESLVLTQIGEWTQITTPFVNHNNDLIELFIKIENGRYLITDAGNTLNELELAGVNIDRSQKRISEFNSVLNGFGIKRKNGELFSYTTEKNFPEVKHRLIQTILSVDDMFLLAEPKVESFFLEDVQDYFDLNDVRYIKDIIYAGRSGFNHHFDFSVPKSKRHPETIIKAINTPRKDTIGGVLWAFEDTKNIRSQAEGLVILNDKSNLSHDIFEALEEYDVKSIVWSEREQYVDRLAS